MKMRYGDKAAFYLEDLEVLESTVMLAASHNLKLGFKIGIDKDGRPALFAAQGLPYKIEDLQDNYARLTEEIKQSSPKAMYYNLPVKTSKAQTASGYGIPQDSIKFKQG